MTVHLALGQAHKKLKTLKTPDLDSEVLLSHVLKKPREHILAHPEQNLTGAQAREFARLVTRRAAHEPVAYLTRHKEFYGRDFYIDNRVHIPRPATEDLIDAIKAELSGQFDGTLADIGTGSGCIAVTLALEFPRARIFATDISDDALAVAMQNAQHHACIKAAPPLGATRPLVERITFFNGSLGEPLPEPVDIIAANLPYGWKDGWTDDAEVFFQPETSYLLGRDGLDAIRALMQQLPGILTKNGCAFLEFDPRQTEAIKKLAHEQGLSAGIIKDSAGFDRILALTK
ncbi:MAG: peptide chain release factor N(5)-glutamine methyltransferase [Parcubacteria group bacterium]|nr:peptide chain release factor N(5)-glutamine methyltransferase [Parcubacteria group bacterium]